MTAFDAIETTRRFLGRIRRMRDEIRTEQMINSLPKEIRKDIGWPDNYAARRARRG